MFYGLATNKVRVPGLRFTHTLCDIETLNQKAREAMAFTTSRPSLSMRIPIFRITMLCCRVAAASATVMARCRGYASILPRSQAQTHRHSGHAYDRILALRLFAPGVETESCPSIRSFRRCVEGEYEAGLIIHEGQLTYAKAGLQRLVDLGKWWQKMTGLPLPLGGNAIRRSLGPEITAKVQDALRDSIQYALDHREEALITRCNSRAISIPSWPTNSWGCTSTSARSTTAGWPRSGPAPARHGP